MQDLPAEPESIADIVHLQARRCTIIRCPYSLIYVTSDTRRGRNYHVIYTVGGRLTMSCAHRRRPRYVRGWTGGHVPLLFEVEETPCVLSPTFSGANIFVLMHNCTALLTFTYIAVFVKTVSTRCQILRPKRTKLYFGWGFAPDPAEGAYSTPQTPIAGYKGPTSKGREKEGVKGSCTFCGSTPVHVLKAIT